MKSLSRQHSGVLQSDLQLRDELLLHSRLGSQIYAMAGMQTRLHLIATNPVLMTVSPPATAGRASQDEVQSYCNTGSRRIRPVGRKAKQSPNTMSDMAAFEKLAAPANTTRWNISPT